MLPVLNRMGVALPPETEWKYSNVALSLAGYIVEAASGEPYAEYIARHVLAPLGMTGTRVIPPTDMPTLAVGYGRRMPGKPRRVEPFFNGAYMVPASNLASTVDDLAKYASLQFRTGPAGGAQILKGSTLAEMQRIQWLQPDWKSGWGLGWGISRRDDVTRIGHGGSVPGHRTQISFAPASKFAVIALTNSEDGRPGLYVNQAYAIVQPAIAKATAAEAKVPTADPAWNKYVGVYTWEDEEIHVAILDGKLTMFDPFRGQPLGVEGRARARFDQRLQAEGRRRHRRDCHVHPRPRRQGRPLRGPRLLHVTETVRRSSGGVVIPGRGKPLPGCTRGLGGGFRKSTKPVMTQVPSPLSWSESAPRDSLPNRSDPSHKKIVTLDGERVLRPASRRCTDIFLLPKVHVGVPFKNPSVLTVGRAVGGWPKRLKQVDSIYSRKNREWHTR